ncbi:DNA topoisomerase 1 [Microbotryomycetes sp. JL221]|nr:DNA topoisomerase 1 [Microbotryomycetes sp. JL221]
MAPDDASNKPYKKRVIQATSDDEDDNSSDDAPLVKRVKAEDSSSSTAPTAVVPASGLVPPGSDSAQALKQANEPVPPPVTENNNDNNNNGSSKLAVFTTGSDDEDEKPLAANGKTNGKRSSTTSSSSEDDKPLAKVSKAKQQQVKQQLKKEQQLEQEVGKLVDKVDEQMNDKDDHDSSSDDDKPLAQVAATLKSNKKKPVASKRASTSKSSTANAAAGRKKTDYVSDDSESDMAASNSNNNNDSTMDVESESDSEDEKPLIKRAAAAVAKKKKAAAATKKPTTKASTQKKVNVKSESGTSTPVSKLKGKAKANNKREEDDAASDAGTETYKWWEHEQDGSTKWKTLEHNGVLFPPEYEPHGIKMKYDGKPVTLPPEAEEVASFFAAILETDYPKNPTFVQNFFDSFLKVLKVHPPVDGTKITKFEKCDFTPIFAYLESEKEKKKSMTNSEKKIAKAARDEIEEPFKFCLLDGRKEKVGNFRIEPPGLFRGRGQHPKTGMLKTRVRPEQITINIGKGVKVPEPPAGHQWGDVVHDDTVTWLATWKENVNNNVKYVFLAAGSSLKGQSDFKKFEKARALKNHIERIRRDYTRDLKDKEMATRQRATAMYLIDRFALRAGNEKGEDEADTVGCCSLRFEHVTLTPPTKVTFDFLGKDSIRFFNEFEVDEQVFKNLKIFKKEPKAVGDMLFDRLNTGILNKHLTGYMDGLTAKVFRTYNASQTFFDQLKDTPTDASVTDKLLFYNRANRMVAILCNHQRAVSKGHAAAMEKMTDKIRALKYQRMKFRKSLLKQDKKKYNKLYGSDESDLDDDWIVEHEHDLVEKEREKIQKKFDKENQKLQDDGEKPMKDSELKERLKVVDELASKLKQERKQKYEGLDTDPDKLVTLIDKLDQRIKIAKTNATDKDEGKEIALSTSKINYIDPRISVAWCKKYDVPIAKVFSKTLAEKFTWAQDSADADFECESKGVVIAGVATPTLDDKRIQILDTQQRQTKGSCTDIDREIICRNRNATATYNARETRAYEMDVDSDPETYLTQALTSNDLSPELKPYYEAFHRFYINKLWYQLTSTIEAFIALPASAPHQIQLYDNFIKHFGNKLNQLKLAHIGTLIARQFNGLNSSSRIRNIPDGTKALEFLETLAQKVDTPTTKQAFVLATIESAYFKLLLGDNEATKQAMDKCQNVLDTLDSVELIVHASFYRVSGDYYKAKAEYANYYKNSLLYLACVNVDKDLSSEERVQRAHDLGLSALLGDIYNFGELLMHPILESLIGTEHEPIKDMLFAFNSGDITKFESLVPSLSNEPILKDNYAFLRQKICLMALIESVFKRPTNDRVLPFSVIANDARVPVNEVEHLLMKALSLKLIKGTIDQVSSTTSISWVQPRVLDKTQISGLKDRLSSWSDKVIAVGDFTQQQAPELFAQ